MSRSAADFNHGTDPPMKRMLVVLCGLALSQRRPAPPQRTAECHHHPRRRPGLRRSRLLRASEVQDAAPRPHGGGGREAHAVQLPHAVLRADAGVAADGPLSVPLRHERQSRARRRAGGGRAAPAGERGHARAVAQAGGLRDGHGRQVAPRPRASPSGCPRTAASTNTSASPTRNDMRPVQLLDGEQARRVSGRAGHADAALHGARARLHRAQPRRARSSSILPHAMPHKPLAARRTSTRRAARDSTAT